MAVPRPSCRGTCGLNRGRRGCRGGTLSTKLVLGPAGPTESDRGGPPPPAKMPTADPARPPMGGVCLCPSLPCLAGTVRWPCDLVGTVLRLRRHCRAALGNRFSAHRGSVRIGCPTAAPATCPCTRAREDPERCVSPGHGLLSPGRPQSGTAPRAGPSGHRRPIPRPPAASLGSVPREGRSLTHRQLTAPHVPPAEGQTRLLLPRSRKETGDIKNAFCPDRLNSF